MNQQQINKHLDSINRNNRMRKEYKKEPAFLRMLAAMVTRGNIRNDKKELDKLKKR